MATLKKCEFCDGAGTIDGADFVPGTFFSYGSPMAPGVVCSVCNGSGQVPDGPQEKEDSDFDDEDFEPLEFIE